MAVSSAKDQSTTEDSWKCQVLHACAHGENRTLAMLLQQRDAKNSAESSVPVSDMLLKAVESDQVATVHMLLEQFPDFPENHEIGKLWDETPLISIHNKIRSLKRAMPMYKMLVERWPEMRKFNYGEYGDHFGAAAVQGDLELVEYLIASGEDARGARLLERPASHNAAVEG